MNPPGSGLVTKQVPAKPPDGPCDPGVALLSEQAWVAVARRLKLSRRECQILRGVFGDDTEPTIAARLGISPHTVHTHFERLHRKLGVTSRVELVLRIFGEFLALTVSPGSGLPPLCALRASGRCLNRHR